MILKDLTVCKDCGKGKKIYALGQCEYCYKKALAKRNPKFAAKTKAMRKRIDRRANIRRYGISPEEFDLMVQIQDGLCAICRRPERVERLTRLSVDHDHKTGKVRGLLCQPCNRALGHFQDSILVLENAIQYLKCS